MRPVRSEAVFIAPARCAISMSVNVGELAFCPDVSADCCVVVVGWLSGWAAALPVGAAPFAAAGCSGCGCAGCWPSGCASDRAIDAALALGATIAMSTRCPPAAAPLQKPCQHHYPHLAEVGDIARGAAIEVLVGENIFGVILVRQPGIVGLLRRAENAGSVLPYLIAIVLHRAKEIARGLIDPHRALRRRVLGQHLVGDAARAFEVTGAGIELSRHQDSYKVV